MFEREQRYARRNHPTKPWKWRKSRYWGRLNLDRKDQWVFGDKQRGTHLLKLQWLPIERHVMVDGKSSPDNPALRDYWERRWAAKAKDLPSTKQRMASKQKFRCPICKETLFNGEDLEAHHVVPRAKGGKDILSNIQLLHLYCHQQVTAKGAV